MILEAPGAPLHSARKPFADINAALGLGVLLALVVSASPMFAIMSGPAAAIYILALGLAASDRRGTLSTLVALVALLHPIWLILLFSGLPPSWAPNPFFLTGLVFALALSITWRRWWVAAIILAAAIASSFMNSHSPPLTWTFSLAVGTLHAGILTACYLAARQAVCDKLASEAGFCPRRRYDCKGLPRSSFGQVFCPECGGALALSTSAIPTPTPPA